MTDDTKNPAAQALARLRQAAMTPEQKAAHMAKMRRASQRAAAKRRKAKREAAQ